MRKIVFTSLAAAFLAGTASAQENKTETIEGNGKSVTRDVPVSSFDALKASGVYELKLSQGSKETVKIEADENLQEYFTVRNDGNKLVIDMEKLKNKSLNNKSKMKVYVTFKRLKELELSTVGNVASDEPLAFDDLALKNRSVGNVDLNMTVNKLEMKNSSVGNVKLTGKAQDAVVKNSGVGSLQAGNFVVQTMNIENTGVGGAEVNAEKGLKVKDSFLGKVKNKGNAQVRKMNRVRV
ncbi:MAG TPA: head GIN domain-containing protein [Flavisolibacter sp.]|nr:head GIN domain-containing protein [Flavisolibacter sp.]